MENINKLSVTDYAFNDGSILKGWSLQGIRDKINEIIDAINTLHGTGGGTSGGGDSTGGSGDTGGDNGGGSSAAAPYRYLAAKMKYSYEDPDVLHYDGEVYYRTVKTKVRAETFLAPTGGSDGADPWFVYGMYQNSQPNIISAAGVLKITPEEGGESHFLQTWHRNPQIYNTQENPGKYLGKDYIFDCSTEIYDTNYGIQCYMANDNGWITQGDNINVVNPTKVPTLYQIYNDPDTYGGSYRHVYNYLLPTQNSTQNGDEPIVETAHVSGAHAGDLQINNAVAVRTKFTYGGSNCIVDKKDSKWSIPYSYVMPGASFYAGDKGVGGYYKLMLTGDENTSWQTDDPDTTGIDTFYRVQYQPVVAQHDFLLGMVIGVIRDDSNGTKWKALENASTALDVIQDSFDNDYDPRVRYIWQIRNKASFQSVLQEIVQDITWPHYDTSDPNTPPQQITVYEKQSQSSTGNFVRKNEEDAVLDILAEALLPFFGPKMPWEGVSADDPDWKINVSLDNNVLNTSFELYNSVYADQGWDAYLNWWQNKVAKDFEGNPENMYDKIDFKGGGSKWTNLNSRSEVKTAVKATKSEIRAAVKPKLLPILRRALLNNEGISGYDITNYNYALHAGYKESDLSEWNSVELDTQSQNTTWTVDKFKHCVYYKNQNDQYQHVYTCVQGGAIKFFIFNNPSDVGEGSYDYGKISDTWKNSIINWNTLSTTELTSQDVATNCYIKHYHDWEDGYRLEEDDSENPWQSVPGEDFKVRKFKDISGQTTSGRISYSHMFASASIPNNGDMNTYIANAEAAGWVDIFTQGHPNGMSFDSDPMIYGYIVRGANSNKDAGEDNVSVGVVWMDNFAPGTQLQSAAYSWAQLLVRKNLSFSTSPLVDEIESYRVLNQKLKDLSIAYYDEHPSEKEQLSTQYEIYQRYGQLSDVYFGTHNLYIFNTIRYSLAGENDIMPRLSKAYVTADWNSWLDLKNLYFVEGPCTEGQGSWEFSESTIVKDMPGMKLNAGDILITLRNVGSSENAINSHVVAHAWINNDTTNAFTDANHIVLGGPMEDDPFSKLSLSSIGSDIIRRNNITIPWQETIEIPSGMPDTNSIHAVNGDPGKYGRFGGDFIYGAIKVNKPCVLSKISLSSLHEYSSDQNWNMIYGTAKINYRGQQLDRNENLPQLY